MNNIHRFDTGDELARGAADFIVMLGRSAQAGGGAFSLALSGGSTPEATYRALVRRG